jgi:putative oxidoreductase
VELALFVVRLVVGLMFAAHGAQKLFGAFGGGGIDGTAAMFDKLGLRPGKLHAWVGGLTEFTGGLLIAVGLLTPYAAAALIGVMTAAVLTVHLRNGFFNSNGGFEYNLVLVATLFALTGVGAGEWSLDNAIDLDQTGAGWALAALVAGLAGGLGAAASGRLVGAGSTREHQPDAA